MVGSFLFRHGFRIPTSADALKGRGDLLAGDHGEAAHAAKSIIRRPICQETNILFPSGSQWGAVWKGFSTRESPKWENFTYKNLGHKRSFCVRRRCSWRAEFRTSVEDVFAVPERACLGMRVVFAVTLMV